MIPAFKSCVDLYSVLTCADQIVGHLLCAFWLYI